MPDIEVSGGSINVSTDKFTGSGKLNASGIPKIDKRFKRISDSESLDGTGAEQSLTTAPTLRAMPRLVAARILLKSKSSTEVPTISVTNNYAGSGSIAMKPNSNAKGYKNLPEIRPRRWHLRR